MTRSLLPIPSVMNKQSSNRSERELNHTRKRVLRIADLHGSANNEFQFVPDRPELEQLADEVSAVRVASVKLFGSIVAASPEDWRLTGRLAAAVTQRCVVSLELVRTRIDAEVSRRYLADRTRVYPVLDCPVPKDDSVELLTDCIDLYDIVREVLLLELPSYPRLNDAVVPGIADTDPCPDEPTSRERPFSVLSDFRARMVQ